MTNSEELRALISEKGMKYKFLAESIGITPYSLAKKIDNVTYFNAVEISKLCELLQIKSLKLKERIFFAKEEDK